MRKLLSAEFVRLFQSIVFKVCLLFSAGAGASMVLMRFLDVKRNASLYEQMSVEYSNADGLIFVGALFLIFAFAVFISIFVGTEYSDGTIRNKLIAGHTRSAIYLSKLIVCAVVDVIIHLLYILVVLGMGYLLLGGSAMEPSEILVLSMTGCMSVLALTAILLLLALSIQSKAIGAVVLLLTTIIMLFTSLNIAQRLEAPEYYDGYSVTDEETGEVVTVEKEKNPGYLTGTKREIYEFLNDFLPVSQMYQIAVKNAGKLGRMALYDVGILVAATGVGMVIFKKKNLK